MRKREEVRGGGVPLPALPLLLGVGLALCLCLLLILALSAGIWTGVLPSGCAGTGLPACVGICALVGGRFAVKQGGKRPMLTGLLSGAAVCVVLILAGLAVTGELVVSGSFAVILLAAFAGGVLAGLFGPGKGRKKKKKK